MVLVAQAHLQTIDPTVSYRNNVVAFFLCAAGRCRMRKALMTYPAVWVEPMVIHLRVPDWRDYDKAVGQNTKAFVPLLLDALMVAFALMLAFHMNLVGL